MFCWTKNTPKPFFFTEKIIQIAKTQKHLESCQNKRYTLWPKVSNSLGSMFSGWTKNTPKPDLYEKQKKSSKTQKRLEICQNCKAKSARFKTISKLKCSNLRPLSYITFTQGIWIFKNIGHPTTGSGGKKTFIRYLKSEHTHRRTDRRTFRPIESIGPEGRCFENIIFIACK